MEMLSMQCPRCEKQISNTATFCGYCGAEITVTENIYNTEAEKNTTNNKSEFNSQSLIRGLSCLCVAVVLGVVAFFIAKNVTGNETVAISKLNDVKENKVKDKVTQYDKTVIDRGRS